MRRTSLAAIAVLGINCAALLAQQTIELREGRYWETVKTPATGPITDPALDRAGQLLSASNYNPAKSIVLSWIKTHPKDHPLRDRAVYLLGLCNFEYGDRLEAFYNFDEVLDLYPESRYFYPSLEKQYDIADAYLNGYKRRLMLIPMLGAEEEAVEMLYRIQQRSPGSPLAEKSLKRTADYYYAEGDYELAADAYGAFLRSYPRSPAASDVRLKRAFASLAQFSGTRFDATNLLDARTQLVELSRDNPQLAAKENLSAVIDRIDATLARKAYQMGDFYRRTHQPRAAADTWTRLINDYPNSPEAGKAREQLARLPRDAVSAVTRPTTQVSAR